jgi:hypothetical protein
MLSDNPPSSKIMKTLFVLAAIATFGVPGRAQGRLDSPKGVYVDDWTHHHLVFSNPGTLNDAARIGKLEQWQKVNNDPRFQLQQVKRSLGPRNVVGSLNRNLGVGGSNRNHNGPSPQMSTIGKDWSVLLGGGASLISSVAVPNGSNIAGGSSIVTINGQNLTASAPVAASGTGTFNGTPAAGATVSIANGLTNTLTLTAVNGGSNGCTSSTTGTYLRNGAGGNTARAARFAAAINACNASFPAVGVTASSTGSTVTLRATTPGTGGNTIALASSSGNFNWSNTALSGGNDGITGPNSFGYWSVNGFATAAQLASNIATAANATPAVRAVIQATANLPANGDITFTQIGIDTTASYTISATNFSGFSGGGTLTGGTQATVQPNALPAKFGVSLTTADCANDFVVYPTGQTGGAGAATIVAFNNIYSSCPATSPIPNSYWAYNTGAGYSTTTSPVLPATGNMQQVALMQSNGGTAQLVVLKWSAASGGTVISPASITNVLPSAYLACTAPCYAALPFANGNDNLISSPYYDSTNDVLYVGDSSGLLHKFTGVFSGTPTEAGSPWPVMLGSAAVSSPVFDSNSDFVFVGDLGGTLYSVSGTTGAINGSATIGDAIADAPLVDGTAGSVYAFVTTSGGSNTVYQFSTQFTSLTAPSAPGTASVGTGGAGYFLYDGMFDNLYFQSANPPTGNLWVVGNTGATTGAILYRVPITNNVLGTPAAAVSGLTPNAAGAFPWPSPLTEFFNTSSGIDFVFFSVNQGNQAGCTPSAGNGCILSFNVTVPASPVLAGTGQNYITPPGNGCWATSGIVIDNDSAAGGASGIYFVGLNGAAAGGLAGGGTVSPTSSNCNASIALAVYGIQASQANP